MADDDFREFLRSINYVDDAGNVLDPDLERDDSDDPENDNPEDSQCLSCKWYEGMVPQGPFVCKAYPYPNGIPLSIFDNTTKHNKIYPTQVGKYMWRKR